MKTNSPRFLRTGVMFAVAALLLVRAQADPAAKVRVMVTENNIPSGAGAGSGAASPAPAAGARPAGQAGKPGASPAASAGFMSEAYTHTTKKSLTIQIVNVTNEPIDVSVKATFLAKDEAGKHEVVPETTQDKKLTIQPGRPESFTTDEVSFTHTTAHHGPAPKGGGGMRGGKPAPMEPASGHNYFGYKVEVMQGSDIVGSAVSANH